MIKKKNMIYLLFDLSKGVGVPIFVYLYFRSVYPTQG